MFNKIIYTEYPQNTITSMFDFPKVDMDYIKGSIKKKTLRSDPFKTYDVYTLEGFTLKEYQTIRRRVRKLDQYVYLGKPDAISIEVEKGKEIYVPHTDKMSYKSLYCNISFPKEYKDVIFNFIDSLERRKYSIRLNYSEYNHYPDQFISALLKRKIYETYKYEHDIQLIECTRFPDGNYFNGKTFFIAQTNNESLATFLKMSF